MVLEPHRRRATPPRAFGAGVAVLALVLAGCGGRSASGRRSGAEPAVAPVPASAPAGLSRPVGVGPEGIVADGRTGLVVVGVREPPGLVVLAARSGRVLRRVAIAGAPRHLQLVAPGGPVLAGEERINDVIELRLPGDRYRSIPVGVHPHDVTADGGLVFVANEFGRSVSVIRGARVLRTIGGFLQPGGIAAVGRRVAVVDVGADTVTLIDAHTLRVSGRLPAGDGPTHAAAAGRRLYVIDTRGGAVLSYATQPALRRLGRFRLPGTPYGVASDPARGRLWVTLTARNQLVELATGGPSLRVIDTYPTARQPNTVAVDARDGRVFVAGATAGVVEIISPRR